MVPVLSAGLGLPLEDTVTLLQPGAADSRRQTRRETLTIHQISGKQTVARNVLFSFSFVIHL